MFTITTDKALNAKTNLFLFISTGIIDQLCEVFFFVLISVSQTPEIPNYSSNAVVLVSKSSYYVTNQAGEG